jgi:hypothetical protein
LTSKAQVGKANMLTRWGVGQALGDPANLP